MDQNPQPIPQELRGYFPEPAETELFNKSLKLEDEFRLEQEHGFAFRLREFMTRAGVPPRAQKARLDDIPLKIRQLLVFAHFPAKSFGLTGPGGCGKSCALAYLVAQTHLKDFKTFGPSRYEKASGAMQGVPKIVSYTPSMDFIWINWPAKAVLMKQLASRRDWENPEASLLPIMDAI